jgi:hypothetical protein
LDKNFINANAEAVTVDFAGTSVKVVVPAGTVSLWVGDVSGYPGSQVVVPVTIQENPGFDIGIFDISFGEGLELTSFDFTDTLVSASQVVYDLSQLNRIALLASEDFATHIEGNGVLFNMIFTIKADAAGDSYSIELGLMNGQSTNFAVYNGAVDNEGYPIPTAISSVAFVPGSVEALDQTIPTVDDLLYDLPQTVVYDGASHAVPVASAGSELGAITVYYTGSGSTAYGKTTEPPTGAGTYLVTVDIAPRGIYGQALGIELGLLTIAKAAAPTITWPEASAITYEQALSASTLSFTANDFGSFGWASSVDLTTIPNAGSPAYPVTFTPSAATLNNYEAISPLTQNVAVTVNKAAAPTITWPEESVVKEGSDLSTAALTGGSTEYGSFAWTDPTIIPPLAGGSYSVTFTPSAATLNNYEAISPLTQNLGVTVRGSGDLDNDGYTTAFDVLYHLFIINGLRPTPPSSSLDFQLADMDEDGSLTVADTILLLRKAMGLS